MFLITNGKKVEICSKCCKLHAAKDCPRRPSVLRAERKQQIAELKSAAADWFAERDRRLGLTDEPYPGRRRKAR